MKSNVTRRGLHRLIGEPSTMFLLFLCAGLMNGCASGPTYQVDYDQSFPFSAYRTYRWYDDDHVTRESQYRRYNSSDQRVRNTAAQELMQSGLDRKSTRLNSSHSQQSRMPSSA